MSSFYMPLSRTTFIELALNDETEDLDYIVIEGRKYYSSNMFYHLANFFLECLHQHIEMIKAGEVSDITMLNEKEFLHTKITRKVTL